jgi:tetratricopeptide (TPR) repeat protein
MPGDRSRAREEGGDRVVKRLLLVLLLALGCRTTGSALEPRYPALAPARSPDEARSLATKVDDPLLAAQIAWLMGNDRELARTQIDRGLKSPSAHAPLHLLRAMISLAELDRTAALDDLLAVIEKAPKSGEAEIAMIVAYDWLAESSARFDRIRAALDRSGLLGDGSAPAAHVALATGIALRVDVDDQERVQKHLARGGWLTAFESHGPLAPVNDVFFDDAPATFRGIVPPKRALRPLGRRLPVTAGDASGVYRLNGCFEISAERAGQPLAVEAHLPAPARLSIDGTPILERAMTTAREPALLRRVLRASAGWHCAELVVRAYQSTKPSLSLLTADGRPAIVAQAITAPKPTGSVELAATPDTDAMALIRGLTFDADHALYGRVLGTVAALSYWVDDVELARELLDGTELAAPRSAVVHVSRARMMMWAALPDRLSQAALRQALEADPSYPSVLLSLAQIVWKDSPEDAEELIVRAKRAAPKAAGPYELAFRLAKQRGWNAEAAKSLEAAIARDPSSRLLLEGAQFYRGIERVKAAAALEARAEEMATRDRDETIASHAQSRGDLDAAVTAYLRAAESSDEAVDHLARAADIELGRGRIEEAIAIASRAIAIDPLATPALKILLRAQVAKKDAKAARAVLERLQAMGESTLRMEAGIAALEGRDLERIEADPWVKKALAFDVTPLIEPVPGTKTPRGLDAGDRWSRHKSVTLLDRVVDVVRPDGRALSLRHSVTRLQTKEATDAAGEINLPPDALTLALRTLKPDGRRLEVDRHSGKEDLSFSGLAPGDAVERKWLMIDEPATPWCGYLRRFYFKNTTPIVRNDLLVVVPKGTKLWTQSYNGAPLATVHELDDRTIYLWQQDDIEPFEPEPYAVPYEEYVPFVVVAVGVDEALAHRANVLGVAEAARVSHAVKKHAEELVAGIEDPEAKLDRIFSWVVEEVGLGGGSDVDQVLATRRGERTGLLTALLRAAGFDARIALAEPGTAAQLEHSYPNPGQFNLRFVRIEWEGRRRWARVDTDTPWLGLLPPSMRNGRYLLEDAPDRLRPIPVRDGEIERWSLESVVELAIDDNGTAKGKVVMRLPGTFGAELREFVQRARKDEIMRHFQGWIGTVIPGARLLQTSASEEPAPAPLVIEAEILVGHFMVRDGPALVAEQLFDAPLAHVSLGLPTLVSYLRVPNRQSPLAVVELAERMTVTLRFPERCGVPVEAPRSFHRGASWGVFHQQFDWDAEEKVATLVVEQATPQTRLSPTDFSAFRESAQEILQASRNRLIVPIQLESADVAH